MKPRQALIQSISTLLAIAALTSSARALTRTWDGGAGTTNLDDALNWSGDALPSPATPDVMQWNGTVAGPLALTYSTTVFAGVAPNAGLNFDLTSAQTASVNLDSASTTALRANGVTIAAGAGAFSLGNGAGSFTLTLGGAAGTHTWTNSSSNAMTVGSDVNLGLGGGGSHTLSLNGAGGFVFNNAITGAFTLSVTNNATATFNATSTYTGNTAVGTAALNAIVRANANNALGTGTITFGNNATTGRLELLGGRTLSNPITFAARSSDTVAIQSVSGANTLTGAVTLTTGGGVYRIQADAGSSLTLSNAASISGGATTGTRTVTLGGGGVGNVLGTIVNGSATLAIAKIDAGTWTFSGANTYTGTTAVNAGTLITTPAQTGATTVNVADAAAFGINLTTAGTTFNVGTLNTGTTTGATLLFDTGTTGNPTAPVVSATTFTPAAPTVLKVSGLALGVGNNIPLLDYTGTIGGTGFAGLSLSLAARTIGNLVDNTADTRVDLNITQVEQIKWKGNTNGIWDADTDGTGTNGTQNWVTTVNLTPTKYLQGTGGTDTVNFDDSASGNTSIDIALPITAVGMNFNNSAQNYTISSTGGFGIGGPGSLTKSGSANVTLNTANSYSGGTTLNAGTLNVNNPAALGTGVVTVNGGTLDNTSGGAVVVNTNNAQNWNGDFAFAGSNNLDLGTGTVTVGGAGSVRAVTVSAGTLTVGEIKSASLGLAKQGAGTLTVGSAGAAAAGSVIAGSLNVAAGTLQINRTGTSGATSGDFTASGISGSGTIVNGASDERWLIVNNTGFDTFSGTLANGGTAGLGFNKQGSGTVTLAGPLSYTGATTLGGGTLVINSNNTGAGTNATLTGTVALTFGSTQPLGAASVISISGGTSVGNLTFATDGSDTPYYYSASSGSTVNVLLDRATAGTDVVHYMSTSPTGGIGGTTASLNFSRGANVSGNATVYFDRLNMSGGGGGATLVNPQAGTRVVIGTSAKGANNVSQTLNLGGVTTGNEVLGAISNGVATGTNSVSVTKSNTSTWTLSGASTYTGATTVADGTLIVNGAISGSVTTVNGGVLGGGGVLSGVIVNDAGAIAPGSGIGTLATGDFTMNDTGEFQLEFNIASASAVTTDLLNVGSLTLAAGNTAALTLSNLGMNVTLDFGTVITFLDYVDSGWNGGTFAGLPDDSTFDFGANQFRISYDGADNVTSAIALIAVPEPGSFALLLGGVTLFGLRRSRRQTS